MRKVLLVVLGLVLVAGALVAVTFFTEDPLKGGLCLAAGREASLGGIWLGLYQDGTFAFGQHERNIKTRGIYRLQSDTLWLTADPGAVISCEQPRHRCALRERRLVQLPRPNSETCIGYVDVRRGAFGACVGSTPSAPLELGKENH